MLDFFQRLFESDFTPQGQAYLMRPEIIWLHVISDGLIALAYLLILITLAYFLRKRSDLPHRGMFIFFGFFLLACAVAHLLEIWSVWHGTFRLVGAVKAVTGVSAVATAVMLAKLVPEALALPTPEDLEQADLVLARERSERASEQSSWSKTQKELGRRIDVGSAELRAVKGELAGELSNSNRLQEHGWRLFAKTELRPLLEEIVTGMIALRNADLGSLQLYDLETGAPEVAAQQGLQQDALQSLDSAFKKSGTWEETLRAGKCVLIEDVLADPSFEPHLAIAASVGFRAMQITPLRNRDGDLLGFGSLYFRHPRKFLERDARVSLHYARLATEMIEVRRAEIARTEDDLHIRRLVRGLNEYGLFMLDPAGRIVIWNEGARRVTGFDVDEIIGKHFSALFEPHELELEKAGEAVRRAVADGRFEDQSLRLRKDGAPYWSHLVLMPLNDDAGDLRGFAGIVQDITDRKRAEDDLRRSEAFLAEAQRLSRTGSWGWKISTGEIHWSSETFRLFGVNPRDVKPSYQLFLQFVHPEDTAYVERAFDEAARDKTELKADFRIVLADGSVKHVRTLGYPVPEGSALADYAGAISDISEQKLAEEAFRNAQAEFPRIARLTIDEYATSIAKEIGQSLDAIAKNADFCFRLAEATRALPFEAREPLLNIVKDANRVNEVVSRARQQTARSARNKVPLELGDVVLDVLALSSRDLRRNRITVKTELGEDLPIISADRIELQQVLLNLVLNAIEAMSEQPDERRVLTIRTAKETLEDKDAVRIDVQDCGVGFSPEQEERMFEAFYSTKPNNAGMGLRISRSIVEAHGGRLLASTNAGSGATFSCVLPAS